MVSHSITITGDSPKEVYERMRAMLAFIDGGAQSRSLSNRLPYGESDDLGRLKLSARAGNVLLAAGVKTITDLLAKRSRDLRHMPNVGSQTIDEVRDSLASIGLRLRQEGDDEIESAAGRPPA